MKKSILFMLPLVMLAACQPSGKGGAAIKAEDMDLTVAPGTDFYRYANGGWIKNNPLKPEYARYGAFDAIREANENRLNELFSEMTKMNPEKGSVDQKIVDLYKLGLDSVRLNTEGAAPIVKYLDKIYAAADKAEFVKCLAELNLMGEGGFFGIGVSSDLMDSNTQALYIGQGGLGMGDRDYYTDKSNAELHKSYGEMIAKLFTLAGRDNAAERAANALAVEDQLASFSWTSVECRNIQAQYNPMAFDAFCKAYPAFDFASFVAGLGIQPESIIVEQPSFFEGFDKLFRTAGLDQLKDYTASLFIQSAAGRLSDDFYAAAFDFFSTKMSGVTEQKPRWKRAMSVPNSVLGEAVGQMYVAKYFPEEYKQEVLTLVNNLRTALGQHIDALDWMSDTTKAYAREKLASFTVKIGYPDKWKDYSSLEVNPELSYFDNLASASRWSVADNLSKLGKATDRSEWGMTPQTVNAYYNPTTNEICFPAAILQPPFFYPGADEAVNYGAIGVVIGHEMTHGFDDQGSLFDKDGNMKNWWTAEDRAAFEAKTKVLVDQFNEVEILPGLMANGALCLGENIADQGGLSIAHSAMLNASGIKPELGGFTADQRFFLGYARVWAQNCTDEEKARLTKLDVHSLAENRVNVTLRNFGLFFDTFGIKESDPMYRPESERVIIW